MDEAVTALLPLARTIARQFWNIPGLTPGEIEIRAQEALAKAARHFDPARGDLQAFAARAIRNALRDLYEQQVRHHHHHVYDLDRTQSAESSCGREPRIANIPDAAAEPPHRAAMARESAARLADALVKLPPRLRTVAEGLRDGLTYSQIGTRLGVSKQAVQKMVPVAIAALRDHLAAMGFQGVDTHGFLASAGIAARPRTGSG